MGVSPAGFLISEACRPVERKLEVWTESGHSSEATALAPVRDGSTVATAVALRVAAEAPALAPVTDGSTVATAVALRVAAEAPALHR